MTYDDLPDDEKQPRSHEIIAVVFVIFCFVTFFYMISLIGLLL